MHAHPGAQTTTHYVHTGTRIQTHIPTFPDTFNFSTHVNTDRLSFFFLQPCFHFLTPTVDAVICVQQPSPQPTYPPALSPHSTIPLSQIHLKKKNTHFLVSISWKTVPGKTRNQPYFRRQESRIWAERANSETYVTATFCVRLEK